jgi:hypothetical protein
MKALLRLYESSAQACSRLYATPSTLYTYMYWPLHFAATARERESEQAELKEAEAERTE